MFKFAFCEKHESSIRPKCELENVADPVEIQFASEEVNFEGEVEEIEISDGVCLRKGRLSSTKIAEILNQEVLESSDLVPGAYEGGFKLWEGALDLCKFLIKKTKNTQTAFQGMRILELGCGHGLPGILCLSLGALVHFQDFNPEVLKELTRFNVKLALVGNLNDNRIPEVKFFGGEFLSIAKHCKKEDLHYDWIIASEILYRPESYPSIVETLATCLKRNGRALIATKCVYFGVGGDLTTFTTHIRDDGRFELTTVWRNEDDRHSLRAIVEIHFKDSD